MRWASHRGLPSTSDSRASTSTPRRGSIYNYFRDYDPAIGRYVESDPIGLLAGLNTYGYVASSPLNSVDVLGLAECNYSISRHTLYCKPNPGSGGGIVTMGPDGLFSGLGDCQNNPSNECQTSKGMGPIPTGPYDLIPYDGPRDNSDNWWRARPQSVVRRIADGVGAGRGGGYLLHPGRVSKGCITRKRGANDPLPDDYRKLHDLLSRDQPNVLMVTQ